MAQMSLEGTEYDLEKQINKVNPAARNRLWSRKKMDKTSHLHVSNTILIHLSDSSFICVSVLSG